MDLCLKDKSPPPIKLTDDKNTQKSDNSPLERGLFGFSISNPSKDKERSLKAPQQQAQLIISDGIGAATAIIQKDVLDELWSFENELT